VTGDANPHGGLNDTLGIEYLGSDGERAEGRFEVTDRVLQPWGIVHGGAFAALAETVCSAATHEAVSGDGMAAMGQSNQASFLRPISSGTVHAVATAKHRGRTTWVWDCELTDDDGRLCSLVRMTIAVRPQPSG
jgi:1,4-dihydroxy-2-naphthoyl-CoA hydrolase